MKNEWLDEYGVYHYIDQQGRECCRITFQGSGGAIEIPLKIIDMANKKKNKFEEES